MILRIPVSYLVPGKPLPLHEEVAREIEATIDAHIMGYDHMIGSGGAPMRVRRIDGEPLPVDLARAVPRYLRDDAAALTLASRAPFFYVWRDDDGALGGLGWYEAKFVRDDKRVFCAYQPDLARALSQAALILAATRAANRGELQPIVIEEPGT